MSGDAGGGLECYFNRGTLMSQIVSRFVQGQITDASLRQFLKNLATPGFPARLYLSGDALRNILLFLREADRRTNAVHAAIYEINDHELVDALKPFGKRRLTQTLWNSDKINDGAYFATDIELPRGSWCNPDYEKVSTTLTWFFLIPGFTGFIRSLARAYSARAILRRSRPPIPVRGTFCKAVESIISASRRLSRISNCRAKAPARNT